MNEQADHLAVICSLISLRRCWGNNCGRKKPGQKGSGKAGGINNLVLCLNSNQSVPFFPLPDNLTKGGICHEIDRMGSK